VAGRAIDRLELRGVGEILELPEVGVAIDAGDPGLAVDRRAERGAVDVQGPALVGLQAGVAVAGQAVVIGLAREGRSGGPEDPRQRQD
jgi:hypothetical protein